MKKKKKTEKTIVEGIKALQLNPKRGVQFCCCLGFCCCVFQSNDFYDFPLTWVGVVSLLSQQTFSSFDRNPPFGSSKIVRFSHDALILKLKNTENFPNRSTWSTWTVEKLLKIIKTFHFSLLHSVSNRTTTTSSEAWKASKKKPHEKSKYAERQKTDRQLLSIRLDASDDSIRSNPTRLCNMRCYR